MPTMTTASASLPPASATGSTICESDETSMPFGRNTIAAHAAMATDSTPPSGKPTSTFIRDCDEVLDRPLLLDGAGGEEEHLVRRHRGPEQRDRVVPVRRPGPPGAGAAGWSACWARSPQSGPSRNTATANTMSVSPTSPVTFSMIENLRPPDHQPHGQPGDRDPEPRLDAAGQLQRERDAADLGRERQQVDEERRREVRAGRPGPEPFADDLERRAPAHRRDASRTSGRTGRCRRRRRRRPTRATARTASRPPRWSPGPRCRGSRRSR